MIVKDWFGNNNPRLGSLHYYYVKKSEMALSAKNVLLIPPVSSVISAVYLPYLRDGVDVMTEDVTFDQERFPLDEKDEHKQYVLRSTLHRISDAGLPFRHLATFKPYDVTGTNIGGTFKWQNEGKLWQYPYTKLQINDHVSTPLEIQQHLLEDKNSATLGVRQNVNASGMYSLFVDGYKNDDGRREGVVSQGNQIAISSDVYLDHMTANQSQFKLAKTTSYLNIAKGVIGGAIGLVSANPGIALQNAVNDVVGSGISIANLNAQQKDLMNEGLTVKNVSGDTTFNLNDCDDYIYLYRLQYEESQMERLGWYFHLYGYQQNKVMKVNLKSRSRFNYIKTLECNLTGNIQKNHLETLKNIFNRGVRIWHVDNNVEMLDFSLDNVEV